MSALGRLLVAFGRFWWDFLVGDTPELFVAVALVIGLAFALHASTAAGIIVVLLAALGFLAASTWRGRKRAA